ncbi:MAG: hypothetical protein V3R89_00505 [Thermoanaerobaculia bacterium]
MSLLSKLGAGARRAGAGALVGSVAACSISSLPAPLPRGKAVDVPPASFELSSSELHTQRLFRVRYDGPEGGGSMRMVLRLEVVGSFQITASDALGRALWSLEARDQGFLLLQHRQRTYCRSGGGLILPEVALSPLPVETLPSVLLGYLPMPPAHDDGELPGEIDFLDGGGRRWTARAEFGELAAWTLWSEGRPMLWWTRQERGGILSHRQGVQFRWRQVVREPLSGGLERLRVPDGYRQESCDEPHVSQLREGQSPS